jgi:DNA polymerase I-like protein with 3'-5' exonuclease and polymerase domains
LIAKLIAYELPTSSIHEYLGRFYFDTTELTDEQRDESKAITFRLLYGGIDKEFLAIPFFQQVNDFIYRLWDKWKKTGCVATPILGRNICKEDTQNMTANKLFNYYLQAVETEVSVQKMQKVLSLLESYQTRLVLYTYDSLCFDVEYTEARDILPILKQLLEEGNFPVKTKAGHIYSKMKIISL